MVRWDRGVQASAIRAALKLAKAWGAPRYVYATSLGWTVERQHRIASHQAYLRVEPGGDVVSVEPYIREPDRKPRETKLSLSEWR